VPYSHIDYFGFQQPLKEAEFHELFGNMGALTADTPPGETPAPQSDAKEPAAPSTAKANLTPTRGPTVIKSAVLEKFRARSVSNPGTQMRPLPGE
jgi:hypothetical protein